MSWGRKIIKVFESPKQYLRKPYYLNITFHPDFYITKTSTNHPELQRLIDNNVFPKTIYRILDFNKHPSLLSLLYQLKFQPQKAPPTIHLQLNSSNVLTQGKLKVLSHRKLYVLKLKVFSIDSTQYILDAYQYIPKHIKEVGYGLYDEINKISFMQPIEISEVLEKFDYSQASLYRILKM